MGLLRGITYQSYSPRFSHGYLFTCLRSAMLSASIMVNIAVLSTRIFHGLSLRFTSK